MTNYYIMTELARDRQHTLLADRQAARIRDRPWHGQ